MAEIITIHPDNPQPRFLQQAIEVLNWGGVIVYPTDSSYALGCHIGDKQALARICKIRQLPEKHFFSLMCRDLSAIGTYAQLSNSAFRLIKSLTPGPYTFIMQATREVPKRLLTDKRKTIGLRIPANTVTQALLARLGEPMMNSSLTLAGDEWPLNDIDEMEARVGKHVDLILYSGACSLESTTVIDVSHDEPILVREGLGAVVSLLAD